MLGERVAAALYTCRVRIRHAFSAPRFVADVHVGRDSPHPPARLTRSEPACFTSPAAVNALTVATKPHREPPPRRPVAASRGRAGALLGRPPPARRKRARAPAVASRPRTARAEP